MGKYIWIDRKRGIIAIPIEKAMEFTMPELRYKQTRPSSVPAPKTE
jgi:hypothetical protein